MDLIDRYLDTVRLLLPGAQRDDIAAELRDALLSRREDREAGLGRPLSRQETEALLRDYGHPVVVAARYGRQQYLIGPQLYPIYALVLKVVIAAVAFAAVLTGVVLAAVSPGQIGHAVGAAMGIVWTGGFAAIGVVTLVFAMVQRTGAGAKLLDNWRAHDLPRISTRRRPRGRSWPNHVADAVVQALFLLWWTGVLPFGWATIPVQPRGVLSLGLAPIWHTLYWPVILGAVAAIVFDLVKLATPRRPRLATALGIVAQVWVGAIAVVALGAGHWVTVSGVQLPPAALAGVDRGVNIGFQIGLIAVIFASAVSIVVDGWRLVRPQGGATAGLEKPGWRP
jgi:hypothetical protein